MGQNRSVMNVTGILQVFVSSGVNVKWQQKALRVSEGLDLLKYLVLIPPYAHAKQADLPDWEVVVRRLLRRAKANISLIIIAGGDSVFVQDNQRFKGRAGQKG